MAALEQENLHNLFGLYGLIATAGIGPILLRTPHYSIIHAPGSDWPNMAFCIDEAKFGEEIAGNIVRDMSSLGLRPTMILPNDTRWLGMLRSMGIFPVDQWTGMSYTGIGEGSFATAGKDAAVFVIDDDADVCPWTQIVSDTLFEGRPLDVGIFRWLRSMGAEMVAIRKDEEMAGSMMIYFDEMGRAGIYMVGIKERFRKLGLGRELILFCLDRLRSRGIDECHLQSTRMGVPFYRALNFQEGDKYLIFCKIK